MSLITQMMCLDGRMRTFCRTRLGCSWTTVRLRCQKEPAAQARVPELGQKAQEAAHWQRSASLRIASVPVAAIGEASASEQLPRDRCPEHRRCRVQTRVQLSSRAQRSHILALRRRRQPVLHSVMSCSRQSAGLQRPTAAKGIRSMFSSQPSAQTTPHQRLGQSRLSRSAGR